MGRHGGGGELVWRGLGGSEGPVSADYAVRGLGGDVADATAALGLRRFVLVGHSFGGSVALAYAGGHGEQVAGLLLVDPNGDQRRVDRKSTRLNSSHT